MGFFNLIKMELLYNWNSSAIILWLKIYKYTIETDFMRQQFEGENVLICFEQWKIY